MKQQTIGGCGISWTICKSFTPLSRQITILAPITHFYWSDVLPTAQPTVSKQCSEGTELSYDITLSGSDWQCNKWQQVLKVIWEKRVAKAPLVTMGRPKFTLKTAASPSTITTPSNTPITSQTLLTTPNGIRIQSAILPQYTFRTHTERWARRQVRNVSAPLAMLIESDALTMSVTVGATATACCSWYYAVCGSIT